MTIIKDGFVRAGADGMITCYNNLVSNEFKKGSRYKNNRYISNMVPELVSIGTNMVRNGIVKNGQKLYDNNKQKIADVYDFHIKGQPFFIDSGGFLASIGKMKIEHCPYLIQYYTDYIKETTSDPLYADMQYFYLDIVPSEKGIKKNIALDYMNQFHQELIKKVQNIPNGLQKMYIVIQCNNEDSYDTFYHFIRDNKIYEQINSHKWSIGGMVPLDFNEDQYVVRPYMTALFDMLDLELDNLKKGIPVYFHILGTSSYFEMVLIAWMNILCECCELPLIITFDSTTHINNVSKAGRLHYYDENNEEFPITTFDTKEKELYKIISNRNGLMNVDYLNRVKNEITTELELNETDWFDKNGRWTSQANNAMMIYESYAFGQIYPFVKKVSNERKDWILYDESELKYLMVKLILEKIDYTFNSSCYKPSFDRKVYEKILNSLQWFKLALKNKLPNKHKSYQLVKSMFGQNTDLAGKGPDDVIKSKK